MNLLLDTHMLLWAAEDRLPPAARQLVLDRANALYFSAASIWEITIKRSLGRQDFVVEPTLLRRGLLDGQYRELPITSLHALAVQDLPPLHNDPFDRLLLAQAKVEGLSLVTADKALAAYAGPIIHIPKA